MRRKLPLFDNPTSKRLHPLCYESEFSEGVQRIYTFPNGYGASVVQAYTGVSRKLSIMFGDNGLCWELAVMLVDPKSKSEFLEIAYDTEVADDVVSPLTTTQVEVYLQQIAKLEPW